MFRLPLTSQPVAPKAIATKPAPQGPAAPPPSAASSAVSAVIPPAEAAAAGLDLDGAAPAQPQQRPETPGASLDFDAMEREFDEIGALSEATYARLSAAGIPAEIVDRYVAGQAAMGAALRAELLEIVGGEEGFEKMSAWARRSLSEPEMAAYEAALQGTPEQAKLALLGLHRAFAESEGKRPQLIGGRREGEGDVVFASAAQLAEAIRDPRYKKDPAYRAEVAARLARSNVFQR